MKTSQALMMVGLCVATFFVAPERTARAEDGAAKSFDEGTAAFRRHEYVEAARAFERSADMAPHPAPLLNAIECWELAGNLVRAADAADRLLALPAVSVTTRKQVEKKLATLTRGLGVLIVSGPASVTARVDGSGPVALPARLRVSPGRHSIVGIDGEGNASREESVSIGAEEQRAFDIPKWIVAKPQPMASVPSPMVMPPPPVEQRSAGGPPLGSWVAFGIAGALTATSVVLGVRTLAARDTFDANPTHDTGDSFYRIRMITNISAGLAIAAAATGIVVWIAHPSKSSRMEVTALGPHTLLQTTWHFQ